MYGVAFLLSLGLFIFAVLDCITSDRSQCRILPKALWFLIIVLIPIVGPLAWLLLGRPAKPSEHPAGRMPARPDSSPPPRPSRRPLGPDDDPRFLEMTGGPAHAAPPRARSTKPEPVKPAETPKEPEASAPEHGVNDLGSWEKDLQRREEDLRRRLGDLPPES